MTAQRQENKMSTQAEIDKAIATLNEAMQAMRDYGLIIDGEDDE
jgi:hypothetical protein